MFCVANNVSKFKSEEAKRAWRNQIEGWRRCQTELNTSLIAIEMQKSNLSFLCKKNCGWWSSIHDRKRCKRWVRSNNRKMFVLTIGCCTKSESDVRIILSTLTSYIMFYLEHQSNLFPLFIPPQKHIFFLKQNFLHNCYNWNLDVII